MANKKKNLIQESLELDKKMPKSDKIFSFLGLLCGILAVMLLLIVLGFYIFVNDASVLIFVWYILFHPLFMIVILGLFCCIGQMVRNRYLSTFLALAFNGIAALLIIAILIYLGVRYGHVFIFPFYFL